MPDRGGAEGCVRLLGAPSKDISDLCGGLAGVLDKTGRDQLRTDEAINAEIGKLKVHSEDTSADGGSGKGR